MYSLIRVRIGPKLARMLIQVSVVVRTTSAAERPSTPTLYWIPKAGIHVTASRNRRVPPADQSRRPEGVEWLLVGAAVAWAGILLAGPLLAMVAGAFAGGAGEFLRQVTNPDARHALQLTLGIAVAATIVNTLLGTAVAWVLVRHDFPGRGLVNALVDVLYPVIDPRLASSRRGAAR